MLLNKLNIYLKISFLFHQLYFPSRIRSQFSTEVPVNFLVHEDCQDTAGVGVEGGKVGSPLVGSTLRVQLGRAGEDYDH